MLLPTAEGGQVTVCALSFDQGFYKSGARPGAGGAAADLGRRGWQTRDDRVAEAAFAIFFFFFFAVVITSCGI